MTDKFVNFKKYNFGDAKFPDIGIPRENYPDKINDFIGNKLFKVLARKGILMNVNKMQTNRKK